MTHPSRPDEVGSVPIWLIVALAGGGGMSAVAWAWTSRREGSA